MPKVEISRRTKHYYEEEILKKKRLYVLKKCAKLAFKRWKVVLEP
jgi:hypothetical protein